MWQHSGLAKMLNKTFVGKSEMLKQKVENPKTERTTDTKLYFN